jgi:phosphonate transport system substrate-binding protein
MFSRRVLSRRVLLCACAAASGLSILAGCTTAPSTPPLAKMVIGVQSARPDETRAAWLPLVQDLGKKNQLTTELVTASQSEIVAALRDGKIDVAWLSSSTAIDAVIDAQAQAFALYYNVNGTHGYKGLIITRADSGIASLEQAFTPGRYTYAGGAKTSTSGYVLPQALLFSKRNTTPEQLFKSVTVGGHFPNLDALWGKKVDLAVNNSTDLAVFQERNPEAKAGIRVLWESPLVPNDVLMYRASTPAAHKAALQALFLNYAKSDATEKELFRKASGIRNFIAADNKLLDPVTEFKFSAERAAIEGNSALSSSEKSAQLLHVQKRIEAFKKAL